MIDIMYPIGSGSLWDDNELKCSLRSVEKHLKGVRKVWIVGRLPQFVRNVEHIPADDTSRIPDINICAKILKACRHPGVSNDFLFMNDDHFINLDCRADKFPYFHGGDLIGRIMRRSRDGYQNRLINTYNALINRGMPTLHYDIHTPILYNKKLFENIVPSYDWTVNSGLVIKSLYANTLRIEGVQIKDMKKYNPGEIAEDCAVFSTVEGISPDMEAFLFSKFPDKSKYEV